MTRSPRLAIGIDAGATNSRCLVVDEAGARLARGSADGANQNSSADPGQALSTALRTALTRLESEPRGRVGQVTVGIAGAGPAGLARASAVARQACVAAGIADAALSVSSDIEIAYAAGCSAPDGTVLIAGTGAVAAAIEEFSVVRRRDGLGYLLGDAGSAVWIGLAAVRAVAAADEGRGPATALSATVLELVHAETPDLPGEPTQALVTAVYGSPPAALGRFAPLVERAAADGDEVAAGIVRSAMSALAATVAGVRGRGRADLPLVVAGAVATGDGLLGTSLRARLRDEFGVAPLRAQDGVVGAAFLALRQLPGVRAGALCALVEG